MNPDPFLIIRTTFYLFILSFIFSALIKSENTKKIFTSCNYNQNPKILYLLALIYIIVLFYLFEFYLFIFISFYYYWSPVLDNHTVELVGQDKETWQGFKKLHLCCPRVRYWTPNHPCGEILLLKHCSLGVPMNWHTCLVSSIIYLFFFTIV
jgi:hypothetical protein